VRPEAGNTVERAADAALDAIYEALGCEPDTVIVIIGGATVPDGEPNHVTGGGGKLVPEDFEERSSMLLSVLLLHASFVAEAAGTNLRMLLAEHFGAEG